jgi:superfamily II RNA helicase
LFNKFSIELTLNQYPLFIDEEKELVQEVFNNAIDALSDEDKKLPQVSQGHVLMYTHEI